MKLKKLMKKLANLPKQPKPLSLKHRKSYSEFVEELLRQGEPSDSSKFERTNVVTYWDEMVINGITGETFTNGENN